MDQNYTLPVPLSIPSLDLSGRAFLVTGGTQGLGLEIARQLQRNGAAGIALVSRSAEKAKTAMEELNAAIDSNDANDANDTNHANASKTKCTIVFIPADLSQPTQAQSVVPSAARALADAGIAPTALPITGFVNAAAITTRGNLMTTTAESFDEQWAVNVRAPFLITQAAARHMMEYNPTNPTNQSTQTNQSTDGGGNGLGIPIGTGSIVNICSVAAKGGAPFVMGYSCAKSALVTLTKNNAAELAPKGIRVNGVNMGWCLTDNEHKLQSAQNERLGERWYEQADRGVPLGRILRPADVAATVCFLLSSASTMMSGSILDLHPEYPCGMLSVLAEDSPNR